MIEQACSCYPQPALSCGATSVTLTTSVLNGCITIVLRDRVGGLIRQHRNTDDTGRVNVDLTAVPNPIRTPYSGGLTLTATVFGDPDERVWFLSASTAYPCVGLEFVPIIEVNPDFVC